MYFSIEAETYRPIGWALLFAIICLLVFGPAPTFWSGVFTMIALTYMFSQEKVRYCIVDTRVPPHKSTKKVAGPYEDLEEAIRARNLHNWEESLRISEGNQ